MKIGVSSYTWSWAVGVKGYEPKNPVKVMELLEMTKNHGISVLQIIDNICLHTMSDKELQKTLLPPSSPRI